MWKVLLLFILGCGASDDGGMTAEPDAGVPPPADAALPGVVSAGTWRYSTYTKTSDTCGDRVEGNDALTIDNVTPTSFRITWPGTPLIQSACVVNASKLFACTTPTTTVDQAPVYNAIIKLDVELSGRITTTTLATGMQRLTIACTGTQCAQANGTPCSVAANITITKA
jgi:hypothetical protein